MSIYAVLGAGSGGQALSATLKNLKHEVRLWNRSLFVLEAIREKGSIELAGAINIKVLPDILTNDISEAIKGALAIFIVIPANAHKDLAKLLVPFVKQDQFIILNPGRTAGALEFRTTLIKNGCINPPTIIETQSLLYACRAKNYGFVEIFAIKKQNVFACLPVTQKVKIEDDLKSIYVGLKFAPSTLNTGLENMGAILHPAPVLLNIGWIESRNVFFPHYYFGISKSIAKFLEKMDEEKLRVSEAFNIKVRSLSEWHEDVYGYQGKNLFDTLQNNINYASVDAPRTLNHRYLFEDIPTGLVPMSELGMASGIKTPCIDLIINLSKLVMNVDFRKNGRNLQSLGLEGKSKKEVIKIFENGQ
jgi:opine dehydrogenase